LVMGDIEVKGKGKILSGDRRVKIHIRGNSVVEGDIIGDKDITVEAYLEKGSEVKGKVRDAELVEE
jgi:hypothetical protein